MTTSEPHKYQAEKSGWRTCKVCGRGANAGVHQPGWQPRPLRPHGTVAAARRHQRAGEPLCDACAAAWRDHQHRMYLRRKG